MTTVRDYIIETAGFLARLIPLFAAIALLTFIWGLAKFVYNVGNEDVRNEGKQLMVWGTIGLFVMMSVWGILSMLYSQFGFDQAFHIWLLPE